MVNAAHPLFRLARNPAGESRGAERNVPTDLVNCHFCGFGARVGIPLVWVFVLKWTEGSTNKKARFDPCLFRP